jgi:hypothetical protein
MIKKVKLSLATRNIDSLINLGNSVVTKMTGNAVFPTPPVALGDLKTTMTKLVLIHEEVTITKSVPSYAEERKLTKQAQEILTKLALYVDMVADGDEIIIYEAGMPSSKSRAKNPVPDQITDINAIYTGITGTLQLVWKRPEFSKLFKVFMSTNPDSASSWQLLETVTSRKLLVQNLVSGTRFYFKVVPVGTAGEGKPSEIANNIAA